MTMPQHVPHAARTVEVTGPLGAVRFPNVCVACAAPPAGDVLVEKMFVHLPSEGPSWYEFGAVRAPLCADCLARHRRDERPVEPKVFRRLHLLWAVRVLPYVLPAAICTFFLKEFVPKLVASLPRLLAWPPDAAAALWALPVALFGALLLMFGRMALRAGRPLVAPHQGEPGRRDTDDGAYVRVVPGILGAQYVVPGTPTATASTVDFGREQTELFAADRRAFTFANPEVGAQFAALNADLVWDPASPAAVRSRRLTRLLVAAVIVAAVVFSVVDFLRG